MKKLFLFLLLALAGVTWAQNTPMHGWHTYCTSELADVISYGIHTTVATCYPPDMASNFAGTQITKTAIFSDSLYVGGMYSCSIYLGGETPSEGSIVYTMSCDVPQGLNDWAEFDVSTPIGVTGDETIWIVWQAEQPLTPYHMGVCGDVDPSGNGIWAWSGTQWDQLWSSTGDWTVKTYFNWDGPQPQPQDVYFAGNGDGVGKVWKNNDLIYDISDTTLIHLSSLQIAPDGNIYTAGYCHDSTYDFVHGHVWLNDSLVFDADSNTAIRKLELFDGQWMAAGFGENEWENVAGLVWQDGEVLYAYSDSLHDNQINALALDTLTGNVYAGGISAESDSRAIVWKNDTILWQADTTSTINAIAFDGTDLYSAGIVYLDDQIYATLWQNDSIILQFTGFDIASGFDAIALYDSSIYLAGYVDDSMYVWRDGEVLFAHPRTSFSEIKALVVNEAGVYYAGQTDSVGTVWKDNEILYQPEGCDIVEALCVKPTLPPPPPPTYTLTVLADSTGWGTVTGGGIFHYGDTAIISATPIVGHEFLCWNDSITDNPREIIVTQDSTFIAMFARSQFVIKVESDHPQWGTVTGGGTYYYGDTIQISATPYLGFAFAGWTDGDMTNPRTVIVTEDQTYTAHFEIRQCVITTEVYPENAGSIIGGGTYNYGETIHLTAHSNPGYVFSEWDDGVITNPRTVFVEGDATYTAVFRLLQYEITAECDPVEGGTVTGAGIYDYGSTATLPATPNEYYIFVCWSDGIASNPRHVTVTQNASYKALFHQQGTPQHTITVLANDPELGAVSGSGTYPEGTTVEISATPYENVVFNGWNDGNTDNPRSVTVTEDMTFTAMFEYIPPVVTYTIIVRSENPLQGSVYGSGTYPENTVINIGATPSPGFYFSGWQDGDMNNPRTIIVTENAEYIASFSHIPVETFTVTVYYDETQGFIIGAGTYQAGSTASIAAIPADGYRFQRWNDDTTDNPKEVLVDHDIILAAFFESTGVEESGLESVKLYPNPANDKIWMEGLEGEHEISIYNAMGIKVESVIKQNDCELSIDGLTAGLYLISIDGRHTMRFIKK